MAISGPLVSNSQENLADTNLQFFCTKNNPYIGLLPDFKGFEFSSSNSLKNINFALDEVKLSKNQQEI